MADIGADGVLGAWAPAGKLPTTDWLTVLVQSEQGYLNLMRLVSRAHLEFKVGSLAALPLEAVEPTPGLADEPS